MLEEFYQIQSLQLINCQIFPKTLVIHNALALFIAENIIEESGKIDVDKLLKINYTPPPSLLNFFDFQSFLEEVKKLFKQTFILNKLTSFNLPITHEFEQLCQQRLNTEQRLSKKQLVMCVLSALIGYLRQTVGSCFATAPCLYIQNKYPEHLLEDLWHLSKKNSLQRVTQGHLTDVPMAFSLGAHFLKMSLGKTDLQDSLLKTFCQKNKVHLPLKEGQTLEESLGLELSLRFYAQAHHPLLKTWEYTVASFCDAKGDFSKSSLYLSLGLDSHTTGGLGEFLLKLFQTKLDDKTRLQSEAQNQAFLAHQRLVMAESIAKNATTESTLARAKSEMIAANYQLHSCQLDLDEIQKEQESVKQIYNKTVYEIQGNLGTYFQESYDPDLSTNRENGDDSAAGFRLYIKKNDSKNLREPIHNEKEFLKALKLFFEAIEQRVLQTIFNKTLYQDVSKFFTEILQLVQSEDFLKNMYQRVLTRHPQALPWAYISGGTLQTLIKTYFRKEHLSFHAIEARSVKELMIELIDYFKALPDSLLEPFRKNTHQTLLVETKTHACQLLPGSTTFKKFWDSSSFTYTQVRDELILKGKDFYTRHSLMTFLIGTDKKLATLSDIVTHYQREGLYQASKALFEQGFSFEDLGLCVIGDTNWTTSCFIIGYNPLVDDLSLFAQNPDDLGLIWLTNMESEPFTWKIYDDLSKVEMIVQGIRI